MFLYLLTTARHWIFLKITWDSYIFLQNCEKILPIFVYLRTLHVWILGFQRRRLIPAPLPDTPSLGKKVGTAGQWVDLPPMSGPLKESFEIKVYEIDDVERLQRRRQEESTEVSRGSTLTISLWLFILLNWF